MQPGIGGRRGRPLPFGESVGLPLPFGVPGPLAGVSDSSEAEKPRACRKIGGFYKFLANGVIRFCLCNSCLSGDGHCLVRVVLILHFSTCLAPLAPDIYDVARALLLPAALARLRSIVKQVRLFWFVRFWFACGLSFSAGLAPCENIINTL
jgi:hypothetical protein